jgi:hypothetical protein
MSGLVVNGLRQGRVRFKEWLDVRAKSPFQFWSSIVLYALTAFGFLLIAAKELFYPS